MKAPSLGRVRIIAGKWRRRILHFPVTSELRPSPDRIRETLFNWLEVKIRGAYCLDLFAGSGAFGFEALSRGAEFVMMVDHSAQTISSLWKNAQLLHAQNYIQICHASLPKWQLPEMPRKFDIVFLDPPFHRNWLPGCWQWLEQQQCLASDAWVYMEAEKDLNPPPLPDHWHLLKSKFAGQVGYHLAGYES